MGFWLGFVAGIRHKKKQSLTDIPSDEEPVPEVTSSLIHVPADAMEVLPSEITRQGDTYLYTVTFDVSEPFTMNIIRNMDLETAKKILKIGPVWADIQFDETWALEIARTKVGVWNESIYNFLNENGLEYWSLQKTKIQSIACKRIDEKLEILELETDQEMWIMAMRPAKLEYLNAPNLRSSLRFYDSFPRLTHVQIKDQPKAEVVISHIPTLGKVLSLEQTIIGYTPTLEWDGAQLVPIPLPLVAIDETNKSQYGYYEGQMVKLGDKNIGGLLTLGAFSLDEWPKPTDKPQALDGPGVPDERVQAAFRSPAEAPGVPKEVVGVINELNETTLREIYNIYATQKIGFDGNSCHRIEFAPNMTDFSSLDLAQLKTEEYWLFTFVFPNPDATLPDLRQFNGEKVLVLQIPYERWKLLKGETEAGKEANDAIKKTIYPDDVLSDKIMFNIIPRV